MMGVAVLLPAVDPLPLAPFLDSLGSFLRPETLARVFVNGLAKAALFVMIAAGLTLIFGLMGVLNFAHGSLTMIGAYLGGLVLVLTVGSASGTVARLGLFFLAAVVVFAALVVLGGAIEVGLIRPLYDRPPIYQILLTFGVALVLDEFVRILVLYYGLQPISEWQEAFATKPQLLSSTYDLTALSVGPVSMLQVVGGLSVAALLGAWAYGTNRGDGTRTRAEGWVRDRVGEDLPIGSDMVVDAAGGVVAVIAGVIFVATLPIARVDASGLALFEVAGGVATVAAVWAFLTRTRYGLVVRAGSEDAEMTEALGIDVRRVFTTVFALGSGLAGIAGLLLAWDPQWGASVPLALETLLPAFVVVIIGGLGTFRGTVVAALVVGLVDAVMTWWFVNAVKFSGLPEMTIFLILVITLVLRPKGLFGVAEVGGH